MGLFLVNLIFIFFIAIFFCFCKFLKLIFFHDFIIQNKISWELSLFIQLGFEHLESFYRVCLVFLFFLS